jgi:ammonia channel protein AmtB
MWGIAAGAFFANPVLLEGLFIPPPNGSVEVPSGVFYGGNTYITKFSDGTSVSGGTIKGALVANAVVEIVVIFAWIVAFTAPFFWFMANQQMLRISATTEEAGMDVSHHGGNAYPELFHAYDMEEQRKPKSELVLQPSGGDVLNVT